MKKTLINKISILLGLTAALGFSSCLKDKNFVDFAAVGTTIEIPLSGKTGITSLTESADTIVKKFAINVASPKPLSSDLTVTFGYNPAAITAYNASQSAIVFLPFPDGSWKIDKTSVVIPGGTRTQVVTVTMYKNQLDPSKSYLLPFTITDAQGQTLNGNYSTKYYQVIGNDFAGAYHQDYRRYNAADTLGALNSLSFFNEETTIYPVTPTQFEVASGYLGIRYEVKFTKGGTAAAPTYTNPTVTMNADDVAANMTPSSIVIRDQPKILDFDPVKKTFRFYWGVHNNANGADRSIIDKYYKP